MARCKHCGTLLNDTNESNIINTCNTCADELDEDTLFGDFDNGPTGHGEDCYSDADPGL